MFHAHFFLITDNEASEHSDERPEDESYNVLPFPCTCSVTTSLVVLLPSTAKDLAMIEGRKEKSEVKRSGDC